MKAYRANTIRARFGMLMIPAVFAVAGHAQTLALSSASGASGSAVPLTLSVSSPAGSEPAALGWTFQYPAAAVTAISVTPGPSATAAGKSIVCNASSGMYTCIAYGMNANSMANGVLAQV